jgi:DNA-binding SARP family transcriptional activator
MARQVIRLLGFFQVGLDDRPVFNFESNKVRTLLAYLAVENGQAHRREKLADLFWPEMVCKRARSNLSQAIYNLRQVIHDHQANPPCLLCQRATVQFNPACDFWLDVSDFNQRLAQSPIQGTLLQDGMKMI